MNVVATPLHIAADAGTVTRPVLEVRKLSVAFAAAADAGVVRDVSFDLHARSVMAIVGESGSGKTLLARALLGLLPQGATSSCESVSLDGQPLPILDDIRMRKVRGPHIGMVLQEPMSSLNPVLRVETQLLHPLTERCGLGKSEARARVVDLLAQAGIAEPAAALRRYPHEFSGGMRQRIAIVGALAMRPAVLIADEPTTALDKSTETDVMNMLVSLCSVSGSALLLISHDLALVAGYARHVLILRRGATDDIGPVEQVLLRPRTPYVRSLLDALRAPPVAPLQGSDSVALTMQGIEARYARRAVSRQSRPALADVSLEVRAGEIVAVVGNSGSGKTTLGRVAAGLIEPTAGTVRRPAQDGMPSGVQMVFQDPASSLDPRWTVAEIVGEGLHAMSASERDARVRSVLEQVQLAPELVSRLPHELSGGQRQRVAIARALAPAPRVIVADEPVSALDLPTQREIIALLARFARQSAVSVLLVTHNFDVVEAVADRVAVIADGRLVELATREEIMRAPRHSVSQRLLGAAATLEADSGGTYRLQRRSFNLSTSDQESV